MTRKATLICIFLSLSLVSCNNTAQVEDRSEQEQEPQPAEKSEEDLLIKLLPHFAEVPADRGEIEQNQLIDYAVSNRLDAEVTRTGLFYAILRPGEGENINWGDRIAVHYRGRLLDGTEFDSSYRRGRALEFFVGNMIDGWNEGLQLLRPGAKAIFLVPSKLAYAAEGFKGRGGEILVPPHSPLVFDLEVVSLIRKVEQ